MSNDKRCIVSSVAETKVEAAEWWEFKHTEVKKFRSLSETASVTQSPGAYVSSIFWIVAYSVKFKPLFLQSRRVKVAMWTVTLDSWFFLNLLLTHSRCCCSICALKFGIAYKNKKSGEMLRLWCPSYVTPWEKKSSLCLSMTILILKQSYFWDTDRYVHYIHIYTLRIYMLL